MANGHAYVRIHCMEALNVPLDTTNSQRTTSTNHAKIRGYFAMRDTNVTASHV